MLLVTGITGHTGRYFLQELINHNYEGKIRCVVRETSNTEILRNSGLDIEIVTGDLNDKFFIAKIMKGVDTVFHIYNIHHSLDVIKAAIDNRVQRAVLVHTTGIYSKYKSASEEYIRIESEVIKKAKDNLVLTILRPTMIYGDMCDHNMSKFIKMIDRMKIYPLIYGGKGLIQPVNARDLGKAYYDVLVNPEITANKQYDLSGDKPITVKEALVIISHKLGKNTIFLSVPMKLSVFAAYGRFIRKTRIDEIPQLFNVLKGDMSIIGPRPERSVFIKKFNEEIPGFIDRLQVKPGITGWAQVNGGYDITPKEKWELDMYYIKNRSFKLDLLIILKTIKVIFTGDGAR